jgi:hypothetical protein
MERAHVILWLRYGHPITYLCSRRDCHLSTLELIEKGKEKARLLRLESAVRRDPDSVIIASRSAVERRTFS